MKRRTVKSAFLLLSLTILLHAPAAEASIGAGSFIEYLIQRLIQVTQGDRVAPAPAPAQDRAGLQMRQVPGQASRVYTPAGEVRR